MAVTPACARGRGGRFNGTAALALLTPLHSIGQSVVIIADVGGSARARAAVDRARPERRGAFATTTAVVGGVGGETEPRRRRSTRAPRRFRLAVPARTRPRARWHARRSPRRRSTRRLGGVGRARVVRARKGALRRTRRRSGAGAARRVPVPTPPSRSHPELTRLCLRDDPVFERDVPGEKAGRARSAACPGSMRRGTRRRKPRRSSAEASQGVNVKAQLPARHRMRRGWRTGGRGRPAGARSEGDRRGRRSFQTHDARGELGRPRGCGARRGGRGAAPRGGDARRGFRPGKTRRRGGVMKWRTFV